MTGWVELVLLIDWKASDYCEINLLKFCRALSWSFAVLIHWNSTRCLDESWHSSGKDDKLCAEYWESWQLLRVAWSLVSSHLSCWLWLVYSAMTDSQVNNIPGPPPHLPSSILPLLASHLPTAKRTSPLLLPYKLNVIFRDSPMEENEVIRLYNLDESRGQVQYTGHVWDDEVPRPFPLLISVLKIINVTFPLLLSALNGIS